MNYGKVCHNNKQTRFSEYSMQRCVDERNGVGGAIRCNRSDTPCYHSSRVQERSVEALRGGKTHQAAKRLLFGSVYPAYDCGTLFPHQHIKCRKYAQYPVGKVVLAKRKTSPMG